MVTRALNLGVNVDDTDTNWMVMEHAHATAVYSGNQDLQGCSSLHTMLITPSLTTVVRILFWQHAPMVTLGSFVFLSYRKLDRSVLNRG